MMENIRPWDGYDKSRRYYYNTDNNRYKYNIDDNGTLY